MELFPPNPKASQNPPPSLSAAPPAGQTEWGGLPAHMLQPPDLFPSSLQIIMEKDSLLRICKYES